MRRYWGKERVDYGGFLIVIGESTLWSAGGSPPHTHMEDETVDKETQNPEIVTLHLTKDQADVLAHLIFRHIGSLASRTVSGPPAINNANRIISWTTLAKGLIKE